MRKKSIWLVVSCVIITVFLMVSCAPAVTEEEEAAPLEGVEKELSEEESQRIAFNYLLHSPTFKKRNGKEDSLKLLSTTTLNQPFSWQFDYEFECGIDGYGWRQPEPTPISIIPHIAKIVVQGGEVISAVLDDKWNMLQQRMMGATYTPEEAGNQVQVDFLTNWVHAINEDIFTNAEVTGQRQWRISCIINTPDETGESVRRLEVTLESDLVFDWVDKDSSFARPGKLVKMGPPVYEWSFGDLAEEPEHAGQVFDAYVGFLQHTSTKIVPGFDLSRSFDRTVFTAPGTQTMTITVTPREESIKQLSIGLSTWETDLVDPIFIALEGGKISPDGRCAEINNIPVELNTPMSVTVSIQVIPKVHEVEYKPNVRIVPNRPSEPGDIHFDTSHGSSFSYTDEAGTWTVSAEGYYVWQWVAHSSYSYAVALEGRAE